MIITIGREYGSGGHDIGEMLSKKLELEFYDKKTLANYAKQQGVYDEVKSFYEEDPVNSLIYALYKSEENYNLGKKSLEQIRMLIGKKPCIIIGRCANYIFKENNEHISIFIHSDIEKRVKRIAETNNIDEKKALALINETDKKRAEFHKQYTNQIWGDSRGYNLCIDSGSIGLEQTVDFICDYIRAKKEWQNSGK